MLKLPEDIILHKNKQKQNSSLLLSMNQNEIEMWLDENIPTINNLNLSSVHARIHNLSDDNFADFRQRIFQVVTSAKNIVARKADGSYCSVECYQERVKPLRSLCH